MIRNRRDRDRDREERAERPERKLIKDWELEKGIEIKVGNRERVRECNEYKFKKLINSKIIRIRTNKGLEYYEKEVKKVK